MIKIITCYDTTPYDRLPDDEQVDQLSQVLD
jgi:hypothetical protein